jgi:hypothetical protein
MTAFPGWPAAASIPGASARRTLAASSVRKASGPPPDRPHIARRSMPSASQIARASLAQSATAYPGCGVESP